MRNREPGITSSGDDVRRDRIVAAAGQHFRLYGYEKTTVADIARSVGFSSAYIYKFFDSKQAIGEAVCRLCLSEIDADLQRVTVSPGTPSDHLSAIFQRLAFHAHELALRDCQLKDMVVAAFKGGWRSFGEHEARLRALILKTVEAGRRSGAFERETPVDETCREILWALATLRNPGNWTQRRDELEDQASALAALVLRSLTPQVKSDE